MSDLKLKIEHSGDRLYLVTNESIATKCERVDAHVQRIERVLQNLSEDVQSIRQSGQVPVLPGKAAAYLGAHEQAKQLAAGN